MIKITADFTDSFLEDMINSDVDKIINETAKSMFSAGKVITDKAVAKTKDGAFTGGGFGNISYDLRSSMGCGLVKSNKVTQNYFPFGKTTTGKKHGKDLLTTVAAEITEEIALIFVAGENYAVFVEDKGYDVITMSFATFDPEFLKQLNDA